MNALSPNLGTATSRTLLLVAVALVLGLMLLSPAVGVVSRAVNGPSVLTSVAGPATPSVAATLPSLAHSGALPAGAGSAPSSTDRFTLHPVPGAPTPASDANQPRGGASGAVPPGHRAGTGVIPAIATPPVPRIKSDVPVALGAGWEGINFTGSSCSCAPPDVEIAAGSTYVVEMTNLEAAFYTKTGTLVTSVSLATFYAATGLFLSDPRILYDNLTGRWFASVLDVSGNGVFFGDSITSDPTMGWYIYKALPGNGSNELPDQPYIGVSTSMLAISANGFNLTSGLEDGTQWSVLNKSEILSGVSVSYHTWGPIGWIPNWRAVDALTPTNVAMFQLINPSYYYDTYIVTGVPPAASTYSYVYYLLTTTVPAPPAAPQPGTAYTLDDSDARIISAVWQNGIVTTALADGCASTSCARITQAYTSNGTVIQDYNWGVSWNILYPAASVDSSGNIVFVLGLANSGLYASMGVAAIVQNEPGYANGYFVKSGTAAWTSAFACNGSSVCRYGDYFGASTDPTSRTVWTAGEYLNTTPLWSTFIKAGTATPLSVTLTGAPLTMDLGKTTTFTAAATGGSGPGYIYGWTGLPTGCAAGNVVTFACTPTVTGSFTVTVHATDPQAVTVSAHTLLTVNPLPTLAAPTASKPGADVGQTVTFTSASPVGGTPAFTYLWAGLPAGCGSATATTVVCTFTTGGVLSLTVTATDADSSAAASPALSYTVSPALVVPAPTSTPASANTGTSFLLKVLASGGSGGNQYVWSGLPAACATSNAASITCVPTAAGKFNVSVSVTDSNGATVTSATVLVTVTTPPATGLFGLAGATGWIILAVIIVALVVLLLALLMRRRKKPSAAPATWQPASTPPPGAGAPPPGASGDAPPGAMGSPPPPPA